MTLIGMFASFCGPSVAVEPQPNCQGAMQITAGLPRLAFRLAPFGPFTCGHAACEGKPRALRRMSAARETLSATSLETTSPYW